MSHARATPGRRSIGIAPFCIIVTWLGSRLQTVRLSDWRLWAVVAGILALLYAVPRYARTLAPVA